MKNYLFTFLVLILSCLSVIAHADYQDRNDLHNCQVINGVLFCGQPGTDCLNINGVLFCGQPGADCLNINDVLFCCSPGQEAYDVNGILQCH